MCKIFSLCKTELIEGRNTARVATIARTARSVTVTHCFLILRCTVNPSIIKLLLSLTSTVRTGLEQELDGSSINHLKKVRIYFILCLLLFCKNPSQPTFNPKQFEHLRRYNKVSTHQHQHYKFSPNASIPQKWQDYLDCRECKRSIVESIGLSLLQQGKQHLCGHQKLILSGCFSGKNENDAWVICGNELLPEQSALYNSNAEEGDNRIWRHAAQSHATRILIYSPDTDTYNIGLGLMSGTTKKYIIQLNVLHSSEKKYLYLNHLHTAFLNDQDLAALPRNNISEGMQILFICTGCDFVSFFKSLGKATLLNNFYQYASFIGSLHKTQPENKDDGFLAFIRLIGTSYFKKHLAAFNSLYKYDTPKHLFNSLDPSLESNIKHEVWLKEIRAVVNNRITTEDEKVPSYTSLWRHWLRSCWVAQLWKNSIHSDVYSTLPFPEESGWVCKPDGTFAIEWEAPEAQARIQSTIDFLLKGCSCKKGCKNNTCGCRKKTSFCGPGCLCQGCTNLPITQSDDFDDDKTETESDSDLKTLLLLKLDI